MRTNQQTDALLAAGFTAETKAEIPPRLAIASTGHEKSGKTYFGVMTAPAPVAVISFDPGTIQIVQRARKAGRAIFHREHRIPKSEPNTKPDTRIAQYEREWEAVKTSFWTVLQDSRIRTLVVDTGTECWELVRLARFGRLTQVKPHHYGPINDEFRSLIKGAYDERPDLNLVLIHKLKKEYRESKKAGDANWTGGYEMAGFGDIPFIVDMTIAHDYDVEARQFVVRVPKMLGSCGCRYGDHVIGFELPGELGLPVDFPTLATEAVQGSRYEDWV